MMEKYGLDEQEFCQLLIQLDLLTRDQVNDAFLYQCRLPNSEVKTIEEILVEMELISPSMIEQVKIMYRQANQIYGRPTGPLALAAPQQAPAMLKRGQDGRAILQPLKKHSRTQEVSLRKTAELRLSPELQAVIKGSVPPAEPAMPVQPDLSHIPFDELSMKQPANLHSTMIMGADPHKTLVIEDRAPDPLDQLSQPIDMTKTLILPNNRVSADMPGVDPIEEVDKPVLEPLPQTPAQFTSYSQVPKTQPLGQPHQQMSLPDLSAKLPPNSLPPQIGEILLKNHDLEEWQLMHALCIQKETPAICPRLGTLLVKLGYVNRQAIERALSIQLAEELRVDSQMARKAS